MNIPIVKTENAYWGGLTVTIYFNDSLSGELEEEFKGLINSWYTVGLYGGFRGYLHDISQVWVEGKEAGFTVDMGSAEQAALDALISSIAGFVEVNSIKVEKIVLGAELVG